MNLIIAGTVAEYSVVGPPKRCDRAAIGGESFAESGVTEVSTPAKVRSCSSSHRSVSENSSKPQDLEDLRAGTSAAPQEHVHICRMQMVFLGPCGLIPAGPFELSAEQRPNIVGCQKFHLRVPMAADTPDYRPFVYYRTFVGKSVRCPISICIFHQ